MVLVIDLAYSIKEMLHKLYTRQRAGLGYNTGISLRLVIVAPPSHTIIYCETSGTNLDSNMRHR